jgi:phosphoserine phosphatase
VKFRGFNKTDYLLIQLKGLSRNYIEEKAKLYSASHLKYHESVRELLLDDVSKGYIPIIISGGIKEIIVPAAELLHIAEANYSTLLYKDDICTGVFLRDLRGAKEIVVKEILYKFPDINLSKSKFTTDNIEDIDCSKLFGEVTAVVHNQLGERAWKIYADKNIRISKGVLLSSRHTLIPGYYFVFVRSNIWELLFHRFLFYIFIASLLSNNENYFIYILSWFCFIVAYEIGYIDNDYYAVKHEENPSLRLSDNQDFKGIERFIIARIIYFIIFLSILLAIDSQLTFVIVAFLTTMNLLVYLIHNRLQRKLRLPSYALLKASHLCIPFGASAEITQIVMGLLIFYIPKTLVTYSRKIGISRVINESLKISIVLAQIVILSLVTIYFTPNSKIFFMIGAYFISIEIVIMGYSTLRRRIKSYISPKEGLHNKPLK